MTKKIQEPFDNASHFKRIDQIIANNIDDIDELFNSEKNLEAENASGFETLDFLTNGLTKGSLITVASRPSHGKSRFANMLGYNFASLNKSVALFSLDEKAESRNISLISATGNINSDRLRTGRLATEDWTKLQESISALSRMKILIDDSAKIGVEQVSNRVKSLNEELVSETEESLGLVIIDYLQLMNGRKFNETRAEALSFITRELKQLARELDIPIILLSQLNRNLESRVNKRPILSDLRDSGSTEEDSDIIIFLYREELYNPDTENLRLVEAIVAKNKNGPTGTAALHFKPESGAFSDWIR